MAIFIHFRKDFYQNGVLVLLEKELFFFNRIQNGFRFVFKVHFESDTNEFSKTQLIDRVNNEFSKKDLIDYYNMNESIFLNFNYYFEVVLRDADLFPDRFLVLLNEKLELEYWLSRLDELQMRQNEANEIEDKSLDSDSFVYTDEENSSNEERKFSRSMTRSITDIFRSKFGRASRSSLFSPNDLKKKKSAPNRSTFVSNHEMSTSKSYQATSEQSSFCQLELATLTKTENLNEVKCAKHFTPNGLNNQHDFYLILFFFCVIILSLSYFSFI